MKLIKLITFPVVLSLTACSFQVSVESTSTSAPTFTAAIPTHTPTAIASPTGLTQSTATLEAPSPTLVPTRTPLLQPPSPTATLVPTKPTEQNVKIFLIALEDNGKSGPLVGCSDSAIPVTVTIPKTQGVLRASLEKLLSVRQQFYGESGLYHALYQSNLQVAEVKIEAGKAIIHLTGTIMLGGTCDAPRLEAQIEQTALQFATVDEVAVFVNDVPLKDALSQK